MRVRRQRAPPSFCLPSPIARAILTPAGKKARKSSSHGMREETATLEARILAPAAPKARAAKTETVSARLYGWRMVQHSRAMWFHCAICCEGARSAPARAVACAACMRSVHFTRNLSPRAIQD